MEVTLNIKDKNKAPFLMELLKSLDYVSVIKKEEKPKGKSRRSAAAVALWDDLTDAAEQVRLHKQGKLKLKTAQELLNEL